MMANNKRLIYAEDALVGLQYISMFGDVNDNMIQGAMRLARSKIENAPTVDAVEVVRCKDCTYRHDSCFAGNGNIYCDLKHTYFPLDGFCCYGERKQNVGEK